ncbi:hypothetical protein WJ0W_001412 [Paenibacillus melissococcoides]|uniref:Uncharacterized protein n=1 Tax=Paenibacillus melissococcoides TaxID=2912268 RepID=A0ABM9FY71_9BACL|nr:MULTISPECIES: hypothetical protein [Paenibacillus]CAH8244174.1 hypothetical protein WJ0W_001412 [Paenibacillus melissococcoides]CAH8703721.1 hypothetical protein HTL2_000251 [Paenibacillus melissococcoides]CAH8706236.1 hypothetical protein WDD9_001213 [Paenibacillus melissococcoides]
MIGCDIHRLNAAGPAADQAIHAEPGQQRHENPSSLAACFRKGGSTDRSLNETPDGPG